MEEIKATGDVNEVYERTVDIYESSDIYLGHKAVTRSTEHQQPGRASVRAVTVCVCLVVLCVLLLAAIIGTGLHCEIKLQTLNKGWTEQRKQTVDELNHFCKDGCTTFSNSFYHVSSNQKSWEDSRQDCKDRGADLAIVNSKEEQEFINSFNHILWIGLTDREEKGIWKWVDGSVLNSTGFWKTGQPNGRLGGTGRDCVNTYWYGRLSSWDDDYCATLRHWICEKHIDF